MSETTIDQIKACIALNGFEPTKYGLSVVEQWIAEHWNLDEALALLIQHHRELEAKAVSSDQQASPNKIGITDSVRLKRAEADIATLQIAHLTGIATSATPDNERN